MNTEPTRRPKTFADEPAWNSGAALGFIAGIPAGLLLFGVALPGLAALHASWAAHALMGAAFGTVIGIVAGAIVDTTTPRNP